MFFYAVEVDSKGEIIDIVAMDNLYIKLLGYFTMNDCYRSLQARDSLRCLKLLQGGLDVDVAKLEDRSMRRFLPRT